MTLIDKMLTRYHPIVANNSGLLHQNKYARYSYPHPIQQSHPYIIRVVSTSHYKEKPSTPPSPPFSSCKHEPLYRILEHDALERQCLLSKSLPECRRDACHSSHPALVYKSSRHLRNFVLQVFWSVLDLLSTA
jgi:hypothetical protein